MNDRDVVRLLAVARAAVGVIWLLAPHKVIKAWTGGDPTSVSARVVGRGFGGRDLALAAGTLITPRTSGPWRRGSRPERCQTPLTPRAPWRRSGSLAA